MEEADEKKKAREEAIKEMKMYQANGWELKEETPGYFLLTRNEASTLIHVILLFCTCLIGNIIYHFMSNKSKKIMK
ncbi:MAG TPA: hypothetical protein PLW44_00820 [Chitinophagales bacterium]|nr:hypothetical protein [Chitinophagales bacterium]